MDFLKFTDNCQPNQCHGPLIPIFAAIGSAVSGATAAAGTLGTIAKVATFASAGLGGLSAIRQGYAASNAAKANTRIAESNARFERYKTEQALDKQDRERRLRLGSSIARAGASGSSVSSFGDILSDNAAQEELDLLTIKSEGLLRETDFMNQAQLERSKGKSARSQGLLSGAASILGGVSKVAQM